MNNQPPIDVALSAIDDQAKAYLNNLTAEQALFIAGGTVAQLIAMIEHPAFPTESIRFNASPRLRVTAIALQVLARKAEIDPDQSIADAAGEFFNSQVLRAADVQGVEYQVLDPKNYPPPAES